MILCKLELVFSSFRHIKCVMIGKKQLFILVKICQFSFNWFAKIIKRIKVGPFQILGLSIKNMFRHPSRGKKIASNFDKVHFFCFKNVPLNLSRNSGYWPLTFRCFHLFRFCLISRWLNQAETTGAQWD